MQIRSMQEDEWDEVAALIHDSTNGWYGQRGLGPIFPGPPSDARVFCEVYEALDPGSCLIVYDEKQDRIAGSCFFRERDTHFSLGIMNADPAYAGCSVAGSLLREIAARAEAAGKPLRLVSSAFNLDSFSLYTRSGMTPRALFQDMILPYPADGWEMPSSQAVGVREATLEDVEAMTELEAQLVGIRREKDHRFFVENAHGIWKTLVAEREGSLVGFLGSVDHPGSCMLGPGCTHDDDTAVRLIQSQVERMQGRTPVFLVPSERGDLVQRLYQLGGRNCELHVSQCLGDYPEITGVHMPSFLPETA